MNPTTITSLVSVNDLPFGCSTQHILGRLGDPDNAMHNYTGEFEMFYHDSIYRTMHDRLVEVTLPDDRRCVIDGVIVLSVYDWLGGLAGTVDKARFRISRVKGIAYDHRDPDHGSITVFEEGRWDALL